MDKDIKEHIYGRNPVREALAASVPLEKIYFLEGPPDSSLLELRRTAQAQKIPFVFVDRHKLEWLSHQGNHQGVVARRMMWHYVEPSEILRQAREKGEKPFVLACFQIQDPHNLGSLLRTGECAGIHGVIIPRNKSVGLTASVSKAASGADSYVPVSRVSNLSETIEALKKEGLTVIGAENGEGTDYRRADYRNPLVILLGGEGRGLDKRLRLLCDSIVQIPLCGRISSLNVGVAGALVLYEAMHQRRAG